MPYLYHCKKLSPLDKLRCAIAEAELDTEFTVGSPQDDWYCVHNPPTSPMEKESTTSLINKEVRRKQSMVWQGVVAAELAGFLAFLLNDMWTEPGTVLFFR